MAETSYTVKYEIPNLYTSLADSIRYTMMSPMPKASSTTATNTSAATSRPTPDSIIADIKAIAANHSANLGGIKTAVENAESERKAKIVNALKAVADLEMVKGTKGRRFLLTYWYNNETKTAQGVEYPVERDDDGDIISYSVHVDSHGCPFYHQYEAMENLRKALDGMKIPFHVAYFDQA